MREISMRRRLTMLALIVAATVSLALPVVARAQTLPKTRSDADWILRSQLSNGALAVNPERRLIWPYLSNFAAIGLVRAGQLTLDARYPSAAWRWLRWYQAHQLPSGFITDYTVTDGTPLSTGEMDSTDAYAGTFLLAVHAAWRTTGDLAALSELHPGIVGAVDAIEATQRRDGLTWAKPGTPVKYLMDQAETYAGLRAAARLSAVLGDAPLRARAAADATRMRAGVRRLWNRRRGSYDWALHRYGKRQRTNWRLLYPDAVQQVWPVAFGLVRGRRARYLMRRFMRAHPHWDRPRSLARYRSGSRRVGYWAPVGWALTRVGERRRARQAARRLRAAAIATNRAWPLTSSDVGQLLVLVWSDKRRLRILMGS